MRKALGMTLLAATFVALASVPAQALEIGPVQVILQPRVVVGPESRPRPRVVVVEDECRPVVEKRVIVIRKKDPHWKHRRHEREVVRVIERERGDRDRWDRDRWDRDRYSHSPYEDVVVVRR